MRKFFGTSTGWIVYQEVVAAIRTLPQEYQLPMFWRYVERKSYSDIAVKTKIPRDVVRLMLFQGTRLLKTQLGPHIRGEV